MQRSMEDMVPETESKDHDDQEEGERSSSGLLSHILPEVVCGKESEEQKQDEEKRVGIISHFITNLVSSLSPRAGQNGDVQNGVSVPKSEDQDLGSHGGIMNNLISNLFHHSEDGTNGDDDEIEESSEEKKVNKGREKKEAEEESVVGIIHNIVSHFPTSIPDDAVPTTDEASILIHSIVKD